MGWNGRTVKAAWDAITSAVQTVAGWGKSVLKDAVSNLVSDLLKTTIETGISIVILQRLGFLTASTDGGETVTNNPPTPTATPTITRETPTAVGTMAEGTPVGEPTQTVAGTIVEETPTIITDTLPDLTVTPQVGTPTPEPGFFSSFLAEPVVVFLVLFVILFVVNVAFRALT